METIKPTLGAKLLTGVFVLFFAWSLVILGSGAIFFICSAFTL
jgi:hypothetical protein